MTEYELGIVRAAFEKALIGGGPGIAEMLRLTIINNAVRSIRHQLRIEASVATDKTHYYDPDTRTEVSVDKDGVWVSLRSYVCFTSSGAYKLGKALIEAARVRQSNALKEDETNK